MSIAQTNITDLVGSNYQYASALYYLGIKFYHYPENTLEEVCRERGLDATKVVRTLEQDLGPAPQQNMQHYPVEVIVEYLKHAHNLFIKRRLPYISGLVGGLPARTDKYLGIVRDLKFVIPHFIEDFILHIYEEEDTLFRYIMDLQKARNKNLLPAKVFYRMEKCSIEEFALEHAGVDDDMSSIRGITNDYQLSAGAGLHLNVIYSELQAFERELIVHARVENEILFPKALTLEAQVKALLQEAARSN